MTTYAVVSDIHGNLSALTTIWEKLNNLGLTDRIIFNAGDSVAYGNESSECIDFLRAHSQIVSVGGNYDFNVAEFPKEAGRFERKWKLERAEKYDALLNASSEITDEQRTWLSDLPKLLEFSLDGKSVALCHYSPVGKKVGLGTWTTDEELMEVALTCSYDIILTGHTHTPFVRRIGPTLFINPGSVGRSWAEPTFGVLTIDGEQIAGELMT
jgi:putative phosphoesterase